MLVEFKVRNFRSLRDEQTLSFVASNDRAHETTHCLDTGLKSLPRLTRAAVIYGANASGKSNLIFALATMVGLVRQSTAMSDAALAEQHTPYRLDRESVKEPTEFELDVLIDGPDPEVPNHSVARSYADAPEIDSFIRVKGKGLRPGDLVRIKVTAADGYDLAARALSSPR